MNAFTVFLGFRFHLISLFSSFTQEIFGDNSQLQNLEGVLTAVLVFFASRFSISYFCFKQTSFLGHVVRGGQSPSRLTGAKRSNTFEAPGVTCAKHM